jgi:hypothetical protein
MLDGMVMGPVLQGAHIPVNTDTVLTPTGGSMVNDADNNCAWNLVHYHV